MICPHVTGSSNLFLVFHQSKLFEITSLNPRREGQGHNSSLRGKTKWAYGAEWWFGCAGLQGTWIQSPALGLLMQFGGQTLPKIHSPILFYNSSVPCMKVRPERVPLRVGSWGKTPSEEQRVLNTKAATLPGSQGSWPPQRAMRRSWGLPQGDRVITYRS